LRQQRFGSVFRRKVPGASQQRASSLAGRGAPLKLNLLRSCLSKPNPATTVSESSSRQSEPFAKNIFLVTELYHKIVEFDLKNILRS
jgi:hypothetical protein